MFFATTHPIHLIFEYPQYLHYHNQALTDFLDDDHEYF